MARRSTSAVTAEDKSVREKRKLLNAAAGTHDSQAIAKPLAYLHNTAWAQVRCFAWGTQHNAVVSKIPTDAAMRLVRDEQICCQTSTGLARAAGQIAGSLSIVNIPENAADWRGRAVCRPDLHILELEGVYWSTLGSANLQSSNPGLLTMFHVGTTHHAPAGVGFWTIWASHRASKDGTEDSCATQVIAQDREAGSQGRQNCNWKLDSAKYYADTTVAVQLRLSTVGRLRCRLRVYKLRELTCRALNTHRSIWRLPAVENRVCSACTGFRCILCKIS